MRAALITASRVLFGILLLNSLAACTQIRETSPERTATEQLLFSSAVDRVCNALAIRIPRGKKIYVKDTYVEGTDSKYLVAALRAKILKDGGALVDNRADADLVIEPRVGALSTDRKETLVGVPSFGIPIPLTSGDLKIPELALFKKDHRQGVVKLALTSYNAKTGALYQSLSPTYGYSDRTEWVALIFIGWETNNLIPKPANHDWVGKGTFN